MPAPLIVESPFTGPNVYHSYSFIIGSYLYSIGPYNLPSFSVYTSNGNLGVLKYKISNFTLSFIGVTTIPAISVADFSSYTQSIEFYNKNLYINIGQGASTPGVFIISQQQLESSVQFVSSVLIPTPTTAFASKLSIGPDGIVYFCSSTSSSTQLISNVSLMVAKVLDNGTFSPFITTDAPWPYICDYSSADNSAFVSRVLPVVGGFLSLCKDSSTKLVTTYAVKINPNTGKTMTYLAPNWKNYVSSQFDDHRPVNYTGPDGAAVNLFYSDSSGTTTCAILQVGSNDLLSYTIYKPVTLGNALYVGNTTRHIYTFNAAADFSTLNNYGTANIPSF